MESLLLFHEKENGGELFCLGKRPNFGSNAPLNATLVAQLVQAALVNWNDWKQLLTSEADGICQFMAALTLSMVPMVEQRKPNFMVGI